MMRWIRLLGISWLVVSIFWPGLRPARAENRVSWDFQTESQVSGEYIALTDIATLTSEQAQKFGQFIIWSAPPPGEVYTLTRDFLGYRLAQPGGPGKTVVPHLPPVIRVKRHGVVLEMAQLTEVFCKYVYDHSPWPSESLHVQVFPTIQPLIFPPGELSFQVVSPPKCSYLGQITLEVLIMRDSKLEKKLRLTGEITLDRTVVCSIRGLRSREVIGPDDITVVKRKFSQLPPGGTYTSPSQVIGKALTRSMGPGEVISPGDLVKSPLIKRGDRVMIRFEQAGLTVTAKGKAREPGFVGKSIRVMNCSSKKELQAQVIDQKTVRVEL